MPRTHTRNGNLVSGRQLSVPHAQGVDVVFYGDSITETWRGTDMGRGCRRCAGVPAVFQHYFGKYSTSVFAVGGARLSAPTSVEVGTHYARAYLHACPGPLV